VLLKGGTHDLSLVTDLPNANLALHATGDDTSAVVRGCKSGYTVIVRVVDGVEKAARLWSEGTDLTVAPTREDRAAVAHKLDGEALKTWNFDSEEFLSGVGVPNTDIVD